MTTYFPEHLRIGVYRITLVALEPVELSAFSAATLRGAFGWSFKRMVCYQPEVTSCEGCLLRGQCPYPRVFEPPPPPDTIYAEQRQVVAPYVLRRPLADGANEQRLFRQGEAIVFEVVLMGWANGLLPYFALALQQLEARGVGRGRGRVTVAAIDLLPPPYPQPPPNLPQNGGGTVSFPTGSLPPPQIGEGRGGILRLFDAQTPGMIENHGGWPAGQWISGAPAPGR